MKASIATIVTLFLGASMVSAALEPRATMAPHHNKRDITDGLDISALLADPSSYLKKASSIFKDKKYASEFAKETAKPSFEKSVSKELVSQFGSKTASIALQQYTAILGALDSSSKTKTAVVASSTSDSSTNDDSSDSSSSDSIAAAAASATSAISQVLGSQTSGASTSFSLTLVGSAISLGALVVLAAL